MSWIWLFIVTLWVVWAFMLTMAQRKTTEATQLTHEMMNRWMSLQSDINRSLVRELMTDDLPPASTQRAPRFDISDVDDLPPTPPTSN